MHSLQDRFLNEENFYLAFKKLSFHLRQLNEWYDPIELSQYESTLAVNIQLLIRQIEDGSYRPKPIKPLPFPKRNDEYNNERIRPYYKVAIDDQLVWIAITNVIGEFLESRMPYWSFGNRLFRKIWFDDKEKPSRMILGSTFNNSESYYRRWNQSWPLYRRHISMLVKVMGLNKTFTKEKLNDEKEVELYMREQANGLKDAFYLDNEFWSMSDSNKLYWVGLDFQTFFSSVKPQTFIRIIKDSITRPNGSRRDDTTLIFSVIDKMFPWTQNDIGWDHRRKQVIDSGVLDFPDKNELPTGLLSAGFLANVAMIEIDASINEYIKSHRNVMILKYVDDQVIIATSKKALTEFLEFYHNLLRNSDTGINFHPSKISPTGSFTYTHEHGFKPSTSESSCELDVEYPKPLMTLTLEKMSHLNEEDFELDDQKELEDHITELEHLLLTDFPDEEIKKETRMAFAAMKLCKAADKLTPDFRKLEEIYFEKRPADFHPDTKQEAELLNQLNSFKSEIYLVKRKHSKIFQLLVKGCKENPDKIKLWRRAIEYCYRSGHDGLNGLFNALESAPLHHSSKAYIRSFCMIVLAECLLEGFNRLRKEQGAFWESYTTMEFFGQVFEFDVSADSTTTEHFFVEDSLNYLKLIKSFVFSFNYKNIHFGKNLPVTKLSLFDAYRDLNGHSNKFGSFESVCWHIINSITSREKLPFWNSVVNSLNYQEETAWSFVSLFPDNIPIQLFEKLKSEREPNKHIHSLGFDIITDGNGMLYEILVSNQQILNANRHNYPIISTILQVHSQTHITLDKWLKVVDNTTAGNEWLDPRLSEWSLLEVVRQIAHEIKKQLAGYDIFSSSNLSEFYKVHPANYLVPKSWLSIGENKITWQDWRGIVKTDKIILSEAKEYVSDFRYLPMPKVWRQGNIGWVFGQQFGIVIGLCVLLIKLFEKSFSWPPSANKLSFIDQLYSFAVRTIETKPISSDTRLLLAEIFSRRDLDFMMGYKAPSLNTVEELEASITKIQFGLEKYQMSLIDQSPRQLTLIDIDKLNMSKEIF